MNDGRLGRCLARCVNRNYVSFCKTATIQWHLISSFYDYLPWPRCGVAVANTPWSGNTQRNGRVFSSVNCDAHTALPKRALDSDREPNAEIPSSIDRWL